MGRWCLLEQWENCSITLPLLQRASERASPGMLSWYGLRSEAQSQPDARGSFRPRLASCLPTTKALLGLSLDSEQRSLAEGVTEGKSQILLLHAPLTGRGPLPQHLSL